MNTHEVVREFERQGWQVEEVNATGLVRVSSGGALLCGDGRVPAGRVDRAYLRGPKVFGGVAGLAALLAMEAGHREVTIGWLAAAMNITAQLGFVGGMHDIHHEVHCGQQKVAMEGGVYPYQSFTPQEAREYVETYGGIHLELADEHAETVFGVSMLDGYTREPNGLDQQFHNDYWFLEAAGVSEGVAVETGTRTIERLNSPVRKAIVYSR